MNSRALRQAAMMPRSDALVGYVHTGTDLLLRGVTWSVEMGKTGILTFEALNMVFVCAQKHYIRFINIQHISRSTELH